MFESNVGDPPPMAPALDSDSRDLARKSARDLHASAQVSHGDHSHRYRLFLRSSTPGAAGFLSGSHLSCLVGLAAVSLMGHPCGLRCLIDCMNLAGESFYVSGGFWVAVAGVVVAMLTGWISWWTANPKRRLRYWMPAPLRLLDGPAARDLWHGLEVDHGGQISADPHALEVTLVNEGRRDIPSSAFDQGRPLTLDVGVPILYVLKITTSSSHAVPAVKMEGTALKIGPDLIARHQKISFSLLVDGPNPTLSCPPPHPIDNDVRQGEPGAATDKAIRVTAWVGAAVLTAMAVANVVGLATGAWATAISVISTTAMAVTAAAAMAERWRNR